MIERIRWLIALAWDRIFRLSCWAETAAWAMGYPDCKLRREAEGKGTRGYCPDDARRHPGCWCGKFPCESKEAK